jgi:WD40 repeat protein
MKKYYFLLLVVLALGLTAQAQTKADLLGSQVAEKKAAAEYRAKNFPGFLENMIEADRLRPNHPRLIYNLADAYALNGKDVEATKQLIHLAGMGLYFEPEKDEDFKSIENAVLFKFALAEFAKNKQPAGNSVKAFSLPEKELITEGIAYDPDTGRFFVSSIHQRKIVVREKDGTVKDFSSPSDGLYSVLGMKVDAGHRILWACSSAFPQMKGFAADDNGRAGIFKYDLKTGKLLNKHLLWNDTGKHALGDLTLAKNGDVYASDSISPTIYKISAKTGGKLEVFLTSDRFVSLQGLTFSPDEKYLFAADYSLGFFRIDMKDKSILQLSNPSASAVLGVDGIYFYKNSLLAIQNGIDPQRVMQFPLNTSLTEVTGSKLLAANQADFNEPTLGVLSDDEFYFIANSQWEAVNDKGELDGSKLREPVILKIKL